jgi:preprotein translocase subunit YajC
MDALLFPLAVVAVMWFFLLRPQQQRVRRHRELIAAIAVGDRVVTAGGMVGRVVSLDDQHAGLEVAPGVTIEFLRAAISQRLDPPGEPDVPETPAPDDREPPSEGPTL